MAWIESHDELPTHPKTRKAARRLGVNVPTTIGHLHMLWYWCLTHRPDGRLEDMDVEDVADAAEWDGDAAMFVAALVAAGWLDDSDGTLIVHDWWEGAGKTIKRRRYATQRQRRARESQATDEPVTDESPESRDDVTRDTHPSHVADSDSDSDKVKPLAPGGADKLPPSDDIVARAALFDAIAEACDIDTAVLTKTARGALNKAVKDLHEVGATPAGVHARAAIYVKRYPDTTLTPPALAKHYPQLGRASPTTKRAAGLLVAGSPEWHAQQEADAAFRERLADTGGAP